MASGAAIAADAPTVASGDQVYLGTQTQGDGGTELQSVYSPIPDDPENAGDPQFWTYCIEHDYERNQDVDATVGDLDSYLGDNHFTDPTVQGKVLWVLAHSYPALSLAAFGDAAGAPGISQNDAIEATQYAIWRYTELDYDAPWYWTDQDSENAYWYLIDGAGASSGMTPAQLAPTVSVTAPDGALTAGSFIGPFVVHTDQPTATVAVEPNVAVVDAHGQSLDTSAVTDGEQLYLDLSHTGAGGTATVTASVLGSSATGKVLSVPTEAGSTPTAADHAQSLILVAPSTATTSAQATVQWNAAAVPSLATTLVNSDTGTHELPAVGGTLTDTVAYQNLTTGTTYTVTGTLMLKTDGSSTGITGSATFTPSDADGTVDVHFTVPSGYAGDALVAFESLTVASGGDAIAVHDDIDDGDQTVTVADMASAGSATTSGTSAGGGAVATTLANTGETVIPIWSVVFAALGIVLGFALLLVRRRRA